MATQTNKFPAIVPIKIRKVGIAMRIVLSVGALFSWVSPKFPAFSKSWRVQLTNRELGSVVSMNVRRASHLVFRTS